MKHLENELSWKSEALSVVFGMLIILIIFGDEMSIHWVGNLDTIFGPELSPLMDVIYPLASIIVFLWHGKLKGAIQFRFRSNLLFLMFIASIILIQFDDIFVVFNHPITLPDVYWTTARLLYFIIALGTFFTFGIECEKTKRLSRGGPH